MSVRRHTNECWLTFVHLDDEGRPAPVPPLKLDTQEDRLMNDLAQRRREALLTENPEHEYISERSADPPLPPGFHA